MAAELPFSKLGIELVRELLLEAAVASVGRVTSKRTITREPEERPTVTGRASTLGDVSQRNYCKPAVSDKQRRLSAQSVTRHHQRQNTTVVGSFFMFSF